MEPAIGGVTQLMFLEVFAKNISIQKNNLLADDTFVIDKLDDLAPGVGDILDVVCHGHGVHLEVSPETREKGHLVTDPTKHLNCFQRIIAQNASFI